MKAIQDQSEKVQEVFAQLDYLYQEGVIIRGDEALDFEINRCLKGSRISKQERAYIHEAIRNMEMFWYSII